MHIIKYPIAVALCLALCGIAVPATSRTLVPRKGGCQMTVPDNWKVDALIKSSASAPDHSLGAVVSRGPDGFGLAQAKQIIEQTYPPKHVFEDSASRLFYAYDLGSRGVGLYVGVPSSHGFVCGAQISYKHAAQANAAKQIALSVKPAG